MVLVFLLAMESPFSRPIFGHQAPERQGTPNAHPPTCCASALDFEMPTYLMTDIARPSRLQFLETEGVLRKVGVPLILPELSVGILSHYRQHGHCVQQLPSPLHCRLGIWI